MFYIAKIELFDSEGISDYLKYVGMDVFWQNQITCSNKKLGVIRNIKTDQNKTFADFITDIDLKKLPFSFRTIHNCYVWAIPIPAKPEVKC